MTLEEVEAHQSKVKRLTHREVMEIAGVVPGGVRIRPELIAAPKPRQAMNKIESAYAQILELRKLAGEILWWKFEGMTLKLAGDTRYTPDFPVVRADGMLEFFETKGFMREAARVRLNIAASMFPFPFYLVRRVKGEWITERVKA